MLSQKNAETLLKEFCEKLKQELGFHASQWDMESTPHGRTDISLYHSSDVRDLPQSKNAIRLIITSWALEQYFRSGGNWKLDLLYSRVREQLNPSLNSKDWPYMLWQLNSFWLHKLYTVKELGSNRKETHKILELTDKRNNESFEVCFKFSERLGGWLASEGTTKDFVQIQNSLRQITKITVKREKLFSDPELNKLTGEVTLYDNFSRQGTSYQTMNILSHTDLCLEVDYFKIAALKSNSFRQKWTYTLVNGSIKSTVVELPMPEWFEYYSTGKDLSKNPVNTFMHHILPDEVDPFYESDTLWITDQKDVYLKYHSTWVLVDSGWFKQNYKTIPELQKEFLAMQLMGIEF